MAKMNMNNYTMALKACSQGALWQSAMRTMKWAPSAILAYNLSHFDAQSLG